MDRRGCLKAGLSAAAASLLGTRAPFAAETPPIPTDAVPMGPVLAAAPKVEIGNGLIRASLTVPDAARAMYKGQRFDWSGHFASLKLGDQEFYGPWFDKLSQQARDVVYDNDGTIMVGPNTCAMGPVEEWELNGNPPGYGEARPGGTFLKPGVGVLRRRDESPYSSFARYDYADQGRRELRSGRDWVEFTHRVGPVDGWGYDYVKRVSLTPGRPQMILAHRMRNTGTRPIGGAVYNHNFLTLGGAGIGPELTVTTPYQIKSATPLTNDNARLEPNRLVYVKRLVDRERVSTTLEGFGPTAADHRFRVESAPLAAGYELIGDHPLARVAVWSIRTNVSVEPFIALDIAPGAEARWTSTYNYWARGSRRA